MFSFRVEPELVIQLKRKADNKREKVSPMVREILWEAIKKEQK